MRIASFNVNSIRIREHQLKRLQEGFAPDLIAIQETKVVDEAFPLEWVEALGYHAEYHGQKSYHGVATLANRPASTCHRGLPGDDEAAQRRLITTHYPLADGRELILINGYFPQGDSRAHPDKFPAKRRFYSELLRWLESEYHPEALIAVVGDMNVAPLDADVGIAPENAKRWLQSGKCSFLPEEREWLAALQAWGLSDSFRHHHPEAAESLSWFDYRSRGFEREPKRGLRIDLILCTAPLLACCVDAGIALEVRAMERPSDHAPVWADFDLPWSLPQP